MSGLKDKMCMGWGMRRTERRYTFCNSDASFIAMALLVMLLCTPSTSKAESDVMGRDTLVKKLTVRSQENDAEIKDYNSRFSDMEKCMGLNLSGKELSYSSAQHVDVIYVGGNYTIPRDVNVYLYLKDINDKDKIINDTRSYIGQYHCGMTVSFKFGDAYPDFSQLQFNADNVIVNVYIDRIKDTNLYNVLPIFYTGNPLISDIISSNASKIHPLYEAKLDLSLIPKIEGVIDSALFHVYDPANKR